MSLLSSKISGSFFHKYLAKRCLSSQIFGETAFVSSHRCDPDIRFLSMISTSGSSKTLAQLERQVKYGNRSRIRRPATKGVLTYCHFPQISGIGSSTNKLNTHPYFKYIWLSIPHIFGLPIYQDLRHSLALLIRSGTQQADSRSNREFAFCRSAHLAWHKLKYYHQAEDAWWWQPGSGFVFILAAIDANWLRLILLVQTSKRLTPCGAAGQYRLSLTLDMHFCKRQTPCWAALYHPSLS